MKNFLHKIKKSLKNATEIECIINRVVNVQLLKDKALTSKDNLIDGNNGNNTIVSLTSYGKRVKDVYLVIESLGQQYIKPNKIILWLDKGEFNDGNIPESLKRQKKRGLDIMFCENLMSYKKLIPTLSIYSEYNIITTDDDVIYPEYFIEYLIRDANENPKTVICFRGHKIKIKDNKVTKYIEWDLNYKDKKASGLIFPTGVGGVFYPQGSLHKECLNYEKAHELAPTGDDIWFKTMTLKNGFLSKIVGDHFDYDIDFIDIPAADDSALYHQNLNGGENDIQIKKVFYKYNVIELLK